MTTKCELWNHLVEGRRRAGVSQSALAQRAGKTQQALSSLEAHGPDACRLETLRRYLDARSGWAEPITGPAPPATAKRPLTPEERAKRERRREQKRRAQQRWRERHPDKADEYARRYRQSIRGQEYQRAYGQTRRSRQHARAEQE